jgi:hypothetical protein
VAGVAVDADAVGNCVVGDDEDATATCVAGEEGANDDCLDGMESGPGSAARDSAGAGSSVDERRRLGRV